MEKNAGARQYKTLGLAVGSLVLIFCAFLFTRERDKARDMNSGAHYKREISQGIDGLTDREMWIEKSANELGEIKSQNKQLQEQMDKVQKVVIGIGRRMSVLGDGSDDRRDAKQMGQNESAEPETEASGASLEGARDFITSVRNNSVLDNPVRGNPALDHSAAISFPQQNARKTISKVQKSGLKTINYSIAESEYDLDENFIFASTYARCVLVGSVTASAGVGASSNPQPVLLRLTDMGNLPNKAKGFLKDAMVIGAAYGELSSESVVIRLERIVKIDKSRGVGIDIPVQGYVAGENGDSRIRGLVVDRAGAVIRGAAIGGFFSGMADYLTAGSRSGVTFEPNSGLAQFSPQAGSKMLEQGASKGIGNAVEKYADFYVKRAEQLQPVIKIDGGRKLTVVFTQSVKASAVHMKRVRRRLHEKNQN
jgi:conjugal transfer pilus assembly protein TraB